jgi:hypothetical protein
MKFHSNSLSASVNGSVEVLIRIVQNGVAVVKPLKVPGAYKLTDYFLTSSPKPGRLGFELILLEGVNHLFRSSCSAQISQDY